MLRLLIVADRTDEAAEMFDRARRTARELAGEVEIMVVSTDSGASRRWTAPAPEIRVMTVDPDLGTDERLEIGLLRRPLPDQLIVVGRDPSSSPAELCLMSLFLGLRRDLGAVTADDATVDASAAIVELGGAFRPELLVPAGGFLGDGQRSIHARLDAIGCESISIPWAQRPLRRISA